MRRGEAAGSDEFPRELTQREREVLEAMVLHGSNGEDISPSDRAGWLGQVATAQVVGRCKCGTCPSVELSVADEWTTRTVLSGDAEGLGIILFIDDGVLSYLEGYPIGDETFSEFPPVAQMTF